ncbi:PadR family transcriptional regulator [Zafaria sp. Z1313]|uniref:PadR family transcriptional regulator n=1 Tax=unclassified Zafaria TaxID=2828765 RepID=UPI002E7A7A0F|nr:PadR family transcriptional regulator [Zafaria sp. J156]MEE1622048.1 PadR family transcriptional regulator [Zafaria sp. J156]
MNNAEVLGGHLQELRRGTVVMACLATLSRPGYGYALLGALGEAGFDVDANTLYPLLRRLEKQGLLDSEWNTDEARPRKFYRTSPAGRGVLDGLLREWDALHDATTRLMSPGTGPGGEPTTSPEG